MADNAVNEPTFLGYSQGKTVASGASSIIGAVANTSRVELMLLIQPLKPKLVKTLVLRFRTGSND